MDGCTAPCYGSTGTEKDCECRCDGRNHGKGAQDVPAAGPDGTIIAAAPAPKRHRARTPSAIARHAAERLWPDVHEQKKLAEGVYWYSCAGHGGAVAVVGEADLPERAVQAARDTGLLETVAVVTTRTGRSTTHSTIGGYSREGVLEWAERNRAAGNEVTVHEVWEGEEDCGWSTIAAHSPAMREGMARAGFAKGDLAAIEDKTQQTLRDWHEDFLAAYDPGHEPIPGGQLERRARREEILAKGGRLRTAAMGQDDGRVLVSFRAADGTDETYTMSSETYGAIPLDDENATPEDYARHGEIEREVVL